MKKNKLLTGFISLYFLIPWNIQAQDKQETVTGPLTLEQCIEYSLNNRPLIKQASIDESIGEREIRIGLADWFPQLSVNAAAAYNIQPQKMPIGNEVVTTGRKYSSNVQFQANQTLFSNELLLASQAAKFTRLQYDQNIENIKIATVVDVSKAYYDILLSNEQIRILDENIVRLEKQYQDAVSQYESGIVDKTDFQRAKITLSITKSDRKRATETLKAKYAYLKLLLGYPSEAPLELSFDYNKMEENMSLDTAQDLRYSNRIEFQQLQTRRQLLKLNTNYFKLELAPSLSAYYNNNSLFLNNEFSQLYEQSYPASALGLQFSLPIFQGTRRIQNIKIAQLRERRAQYDEENITRAINTEYESALANYKSEYNDYLTLKDNLVLAEEVYDVIKLQYDEGIKTYLDLIVAESDLRTVQLNYYNALYRVMSSKLDFERALGVIEVK